MQDRLAYEVVLVEHPGLAHDERWAVSRVVTVASRLAAGIELGEVAEAGGFSVEWRLAHDPRSGIVVEVGGADVVFDPFQFRADGLLPSLRSLAGQTAAALDAART